MHQQPSMTADNSHTYVQVHFCLGRRHPLPSMAICCTAEEAPSRKCAPHCPQQRWSALRHSFQRARQPGRAA